MALASHQGNFEILSLQIIILDCMAFCILSMYKEFLAFHLKVCNPESKALIEYGEPCSQFSKNIHRK